jgi:mRNA interferase MazF
MRVLDKTRLIRKLGQLKRVTLARIEEIVLLTLGYDIKSTFLIVIGEDY